MKIQRYKIIAWVAVAILLAVAAAYVAEFDRLANTFDAKNLVIKSTAFGLVTGILLRWLFNKYVASSVTSLQLWAACLLLPALFAPLFGSWSNRLLAPYPAKPVSFEFFQEKPFAASRFGFLEGEKIEPSGYYVFVIRNGKIERLRSKISRFRNLERGATIQLPVKKGLFGYEVVEWQD